MFCPLKRPCKKLDGSQYYSLIDPRYKCKLYLTSCDTCFHFSPLLMALITLRLSECFPLWPVYVAAILLKCIPVHFNGWFTAHQNPSQPCFWVPPATTAGARLTPVPRATSSRHTSSQRRRTRTCCTVSVVHTASTNTGPIAVTLNAQWR